MNDELPDGLLEVLERAASAVPPSVSLLDEVQRTEAEWRAAQLVSTEQVKRAANEAVSAVALGEARRAPNGHVVISPIRVSVGGLSLAIDAKSLLIAAFEAALARKLMELDAARRRALSDYGEAVGVPLLEALQR